MEGTQLNQRQLFSVGVEQWGHWIIVRNGKKSQGRPAFINCRRGMVLGFLVTELGRTAG